MDIKDTESIYPPLPFQESILLDHPDPHLACDQLHCRLEGPLDIARLERAAQQTVDSHPILRTFFVWRRVDRPFQLVLRQCRLSIEHLDWRNVGHVLDGLLQRERERGFEPDKAPLVRLILCRTGDAAYELIVSYHRTILDRKHARLFVHELLRLYAGGAPETAEGASYADYIAWLKTQDASQANDFWRTTFADFGSSTPLTMERFSAALPNEKHDFVEQSLQLSPDLVRDNGAAVVHGVWALLLSRYSGEDDVVFGTTVDSFPTHLRRAGVLLGPLTNTLPLRVRTAADTPVGEWLKDIESQLQNVQRYAHTSLTSVQKIADLLLFESCVVLESKASPQQYGDITLRDASDVSADFPLTLTYDADSHLLRLRYDRRRFEDAAITQVMTHAQILLDALAKNSDRPLSSISMLTPQEERQLVVDAHIDYPQDQCIHWLVEEQVRKTPTATAVVFEDQQITYQELNERANQLAHHLQSMGVGPDVLVAICMERSLDLIAGILAILKSGGAWVPLDPTYPSDRLAFMLEDTQAPVLLTQEEVLDRLPSHWGQIVCVDDIDDKLASQSKENPTSATGGANLAYVMYTSGSTGKPKGAMVHHRGICNTAQEMVRVFDQKPGTRLLQLASVSFDMSVFDIVPALISGATLCLTRQDSILGNDLAKTLKDQRIDSLTIPPSVLATVPESELPNLKSIRVAGEAVTADLLAHWLPGRSLYNAYGPAEGSIWASGGFVNDDQPPNIGRPIANTQIYVLDSSLRPVPAGVPGEIYFSGVGVCRGYLNAPDATAEAFLPNPFGNTPGDRLYKTGDRARYLPDGNLEFVGRVDHQVKLHGFRIELGEIEAILSTYPGLTHTAVVIRDDVAGDKRLVAYVVSPDVQDLPADELRRFLRTKLPEPMIPSAFVLLETMPLTANGKLDRAALPEPEFNRPKLEIPFVAPRNEMEATLAKIFADVLGIDEVGVEDSFFDLGGHSLLATQLVSRVRLAFEVDLPVAHIFRRQTVAEIAKLIEEHRNEAIEIQPPIVAVPRSQHA